MDVLKSPDPFLNAVCLTRHQTFPTHPPLSLLYIPDSFPPPETLMKRASSSNPIQQQYPIPIPQHPLTLPP